MIENSEIHGWDKKTQLLKELVRKDIETILTESRKKKKALAKFAKFYLSLVSEIKTNLKRLSDFLVPENPTILEEFQKYISQASVEPNSVKRRHKFLEKAFKYYLDPKTKGKIIGSN